MRAIHLDGFKSFFEPQRIKLSSLTVFSGANSSGKSSAAQALLLLKQTIESQYDPGVLLLDGPNARFTSLDQIVSKRPGVEPRPSFNVGVETEKGWHLTAEYGRKSNAGLEVKAATLKDPDGRSVSFKSGKKFNSDEDSILLDWTPNAKKILESVPKNKIDVVWDSVAARCFPDLSLYGQFEMEKGSSIQRLELGRVPIQANLRRQIAEIIHIQGLRGNPERTYAATARVVKSFPGLFTDYVASVIQLWQGEGSSKIAELGDDLKVLGLSWKIRTVPVHDTQVEIRVSRLPDSTQGGAHDLVNLADVGIGVSQVLPFLVALRAAKKGQIVLVEQPEIHLHPRAQYALVDIIVGAVSRGVRVWVETHSASLLRGIQSRIASGVLDQRLVAMNWFSRDPHTGSTHVSTADLNERGQYGKWPVDFDDVSMAVERDYLDAVATRSPAVYKG